MIALQRIQLAGHRFVVLEEAEYERLCARAGEALPLKDEDLPPLPQPDEHGLFPALDYARISLARDIIRDRRAAGLTQSQLAQMCGTRQETISRIESGKYTASVKLVDRIDRALRLAIQRKNRKPGNHKAKQEK